MTRTATFTEGQKYLICWAASSPTRIIYTGWSVPYSAPLGVEMTALRGLEKRGFFCESGAGFFALTESGLRLAASWADDVERHLRDTGATSKIAAWHVEVAQLRPGPAPRVRVGRARIAGMPRKPSRAADEIASASASSGAPDAITAASLGVSRARVAQARGETGTPANRPPHRPRSTTYTARTAAGREALAVLVGIAERKGWAVTDLLAWIDENAPRRK